MYYLKYEKNVSPKTIENYTLRLNRLVEYVGDIEISKLNRMQVLDYRMALTNFWLSVRTINYHIVAIRALLLMSIRCNISNDNALSNCPTNDSAVLCTSPFKYSSNSSFGISSVSILSSQYCLILSGLVVPPYFTQVLFSEGYNSVCPESRYSTNWVSHISSLPEKKCSRQSSNLVIK